jgi:hypothetical protein
LEHSLGLSRIHFNVEQLQQFAALVEIQVARSVLIRFMELLFQPPAISDVKETTALSINGRRSSIVSVSLLRNAQIQCASSEVKLTALTVPRDAMTKVLQMTRFHSSMEEWKKLLTRDPLGDDGETE